MLVSCWAWLHYENYQAGLVRIFSSVLKSRQRFLGPATLGHSRLGADVTEGAGEAQGSAPICGGHFPLSVVASFKGPCCCLRRLGVHSAASFILLLPLVPALTNANNQHLAQNNGTFVPSLNVSADHSKLVKTYVDKYNP